MKTGNPFVCSLLAGVFAVGVLVAAAMPVAVAQEPAAVPEEESSQPVGDAWITTKVKAELLAAADVSGLDISVETTNGAVTLSGEVDSAAQIEKAIDVAKNIEGVNKVDATRLTVKAAQ